MVMPKIKFKDGLKATMPTLDFREPGITSDTEEIFVGGLSGNIQLAKQSDLNITNANVATNTANIATNTATLNSIGTINANAELVAARGTYPTLAPRLDNVDTSLADRATDLSVRGINVKTPFFTGLTSAKGDGVTDDTAAIQAIINYANSNGISHIFIPVGTYIISSPLTFPSNIRIWGQGTIKAKNGIAGMSLLINNDQVNGNSNIIIEGITLDGNIQNATSTSPYNFGIDLRNVNTVRIKDVTIKNTGGDGIYLGKGTANGCVNVLIDKISVDNAGRNGVSVVYGSNITVKGSSFTNIVLPSNPGAAIDVEPNTTDTLTTVLIEDNYAYNCVYGFDVWGVASGVTMNDIVVRDNRAVNCGEGYLISTVNQLVLTGNKAWHCTQSGIVLSYTDKAIIKNNTVIDCNTSNGTYYGIHLYQNNTNAEIKNNTVLVTDISQYQVTNIYESGTGNSNNTFAFNTCYPYKTSGLFMGGTTPNDVMNARYDTIPNSSNFKVGNRRWTTGTAAPTTGSWNIGDICWNTNPAPSGFIGWVCTTAGTPGTWKTFGTISA